MESNDPNRQAETARQPLDPPIKRQPSKWPIYLILVGYLLFVVMTYYTLSETHPGTSIRPMVLMIQLAAINVFLIIWGVYFFNYYWLGDKTRASSKPLGLLCLALSLGSCCWCSTVIEFFCWVFDLKLSS